MSWVGQSAAPQSGTASMGRWGRAKGEPMGPQRTQVLTLCFPRKLCAPWSAWFCGVSPRPGGSQGSLVLVAGSGPGEDLVLAWYSGASDSVEASFTWPGEAGP